MSRLLFLLLLLLVQVKPHHICVHCTKFHCAHTILFAQRASMCERARADKMIINVRLNHPGARQAKAFYSLKIRRRRRYALCEHQWTRAIATQFPWRNGTNLHICTSLVVKFCVFSCTSVQWATAHSTRIIITRAKKDKSDDDRKSMYI